MDLSKKLQISIVTDHDIWINDYVVSYIEKLKSNNHNVLWIHDIKKTPTGDICILLGCGQFMEKKIRIKNKSNVVVHESAVPNGKGWSPLTWQIIEGKNTVPISLIEAGEDIDSGQIYFQKEMKFEGDELIDEIRNEQAKKSFELCDLLIDNYPRSVQNGQNQKGKSTFYKKRNPEDSKLDINKSLIENFNLLRTVDNKKYPAFFCYKNNKYILKIEKN